MATGVKNAPRQRAPDIERFTNADVTVEEMLPGLAWIRIPDPGWPHPKGRPLLDVSSGMDAAPEIQAAANV